MKTIFLRISMICCALLWVVQGIAQIDTVYNLGTDNNIISKAALEQRIEKMQTGLKNDTTEWLVSFQVTHEKQLEGQLIRYGLINITAGSLVSEADKLNWLLHRPVPEFNFTTLGGKNLRSTDLQGKVMLLNFWFTRCRPCIAEMPMLNEIKAAYAGQNIVFVSMAPEDEPEIRKFLSKHEFNFDHIADADVFLKQFGVGFPKNILVDQQGIIRYIGGGLVGENENGGEEANPTFLKTLIDDLLQKD